MLHTAQTVVTISCAGRDWDVWSYSINFFQSLLNQVKHYWSLSVKPLRVSIGFSPGLLFGVQSAPISKKLEPYIPKLSNMVNDLELLRIKLPSKTSCQTAFLNILNMVERVADPGFSDGMPAARAKGREPECCFETVSRLCLKMMNTYLRSYHCWHRSLQIKCC